MKTKTIFKALAFAMMMPAMLLTTACSSNDDSVINNGNNNKKSKALPLTVNVNRQGDNATTRATYNESDRELSFSSGDKLFVEGENGDWQFAGTLVWGTGDTFSGEIIVDNLYYDEEYTGTAIQLLQGASSGSGNHVTATLLPNGYDTNFLYISDEGDYNASLDVVDYDYAFASTKKEAVEQFSYETANGYSDGFSLSPQSAILSFTINGLKEHGSAVNVSLSDGLFWDIDGSVTTDASGTATFAMALPEGENMDGYTLTVGGDAEEFEFGNKELVAGHIYNIEMTALYVFDVTDSGDDIYYSYDETWEQAISNHSTKNPYWSIKGDKVCNNRYGADLVLKEGGSYVNPDAKIITSASYTLGGLEELDISYNTIYYLIGETWQEAILNHPDDNDDWEIKDGKVYNKFGEKAVIKGGNFVDPNSAITSGTYSLKDFEEIEISGNGSTIISISYYEGETWEDAKSNHNLYYNQDWEIKDGKVYSDEGYPLTLNDNYVSSNSDISSAANYKWEYHFVIGSCNIYYYEGQTWDEAKSSHSGRNNEWRISNGKVYNASNEPLSDGDFYIDPSDTIDYGIFYEWGELDD